MIAVPVVSPVVVGVDGSPAADRAVHWAAQDAARRGAPLLVLAALPSAPSADVSGLLVRASSAHRARTGEHLATAAALARALGVEQVRTEVVTCSPAAALLEHGRTARVLVVGSRGMAEHSSGMGRSVSTAVATHAHCPVVVVQDVDVPNGPVVVGVDGSPTSALATAVAFEEAAMRGAELVAVHAWTDLDLAAVYALDSNAVELDAEQLAQAEAGVLDRALQRHVARWPDVVVRPVVVQDRPVRHLLAAAAGAQLLVVGSHGRGGFASMLLGSTSRALLHSVDCPLMVVRAP